MKTAKGLSLFATFLTAILAVPATSSAAVIYNTFAPDDSYGALGDPVDSIGVRWTSFVASDDWILTNYEIGISDTGRNDLDFTTWYVLLQLREDDGTGKPGSQTIESNQFNYDLFHPVLSGIQSRSSSVKPLLTAGKRYWLVLTPNFNTDNAVKWNFNSAGFTSLQYGLFLNPPSIQTDFAYRLSGTLASEATPVPEPTSLLLLGSGFVGVAAKARRSKKQS